MTGFTKIRFGKYWEFIPEVGNMDGGNAVITFNNSLPKRMLQIMPRDVPIIAHEVKPMITWEPRTQLSLYPDKKLNISTCHLYELTLYSLVYASRMYFNSTRNLHNLVLWPWHLTFWPQINRGLLSELGHIYVKFKSNWASRTSCVGYAISVLRNSLILLCPCLLCYILE